MRRRNIQTELTILFADLRGYTALSRTLTAGRVQELLAAFYDECVGAIWEHDGLLNKTLGDGVMAIFNFPIARPDHARQALAAARDIRRRDVVRGLTGTFRSHGRPRMSARTRSLALEPSSCEVSPNAS